MNDLTTVNTALNIKLSPLEREICEYKADLMTNRAIAQLLGVRTSDVTKILTKPELVEFTNELIIAKNKASFASKAMRVKLLSDIIDDKLEKMEEDGTRLAESTKKDLVELVDTIDGILKEQEKSELGTDKNDIYVNILNAVMDK
jgi:hypothetical protein